MKTIYLNLILLLVTISVTAQQKLSKIDQSVRANKDVTVDLNTSHTNIIVETWNKDYIEVEAYIESKKLTKEQLQKAIDNWEVSLTGDSDYVTITSKGARGIWSDELSMTILDEASIEALANLPETLELNLEPMLKSLENLEVLGQLPEKLKLLNLPKSPDGNYNIDFDYDRYKKEGEPYLNSWSKKYRTEYGEAYEKEMREWAKSINQEDLDQFEKEMEAWGKQLGKKMEDAFGPDFEKRMEEWGENFGKQLEESLGKDFEQKMEAWGERFENEIAPKLEAWGKQFEAEFERKLEAEFNEDGKKTTKKSGKLFEDIDYNTTKTIIIKMPKKAKLKLNVRHGELKLANVLENTKGDISHGSFIANHITGGNTSINVSYAKVAVKDWMSGELKLKYVDDAIIANANNLILNAVSSDIEINTLSGNSVINGSFGDLLINSIASDFSNLNIILENSDAKLKLPNTDYNLFYSGNKSKFNNVSTSNKTIKHYPNNNSNTSKTIVINAKFSTVVAK
ncbi:hypothetical protein [Olleya aquimaris]|uniref:Adhesin domain-containing protein n=1 Tax=Olleya aquimaris TaxID=639310 RepID=A0A327RGW3_9FLAO|nr:hypothetical protein [Olleya aquimaris]RAJ12967.1 hypothetical protein LY08_02249 [Olleya aquimaris]